MSYDKLFLHMINEHDIILNEQEMQEICNIVKDIQVNAVPSNTPLNPILDIADVSRSLFIELAVRANLIFPVTEQELDWFDEGTDFKKCGDFMPRLFNEVYRIHNNG